MVENFFEITKPIYWRQASFQLRTSVYAKPPPIDFLKFSLILSVASPFKKGFEFGDESRSRSKSLSYNAACLWKLSSLKSLSILISVIAAGSMLQKLVSAYFISFFDTFPSKSISNDLNTS